MRISDWSSDVCSSDLQHDEKRHLQSPVAWLDAGSALNDECSSATAMLADRGIRVLIISFTYSLNSASAGIRSGVSRPICKLPMNVAYAKRAQCRAKIGRAHV